MSKKLNQLNAHFKRDEQEMRKRRGQAIELRRQVLRVMLSELLDIKTERYRELQRKQDEIYSR